MSALPAASLGHGYAAYFHANGITPFEPPALPVETNQEYVATRLREAHDVFHVVTGYGTDELGELELQWFSMGNLGWGAASDHRVPRVVLHGRMKKYGGLWVGLQRARAAYRRGRRSRTLASVYWEDYWHMPLRDVQALLCAPVERMLEPRTADRACGHAGSPAADA
jgi:ubiquinone biosynthesis protein COQ4